MAFFNQQSGYKASLVNRTQDDDATGIVIAVEANLQQEGDEIFIKNTTMMNYSQISNNNNNNTGIGGREASRPADRSNISRQHQ